MLAALLALVPGSCSGEPSTEPKAEVGRPAPAFSSSDLGGRPVNLADFRGRVVLLNFWASWCKPCRDEFPQLRAVHGEDVAVVGVLYDDTPDEARAFAREYRATWPTVVDPDGDIARAYGVGSGIPATWLVDRDGVLVARHFGELGPKDFDRLLGGLIR